MPGEEEQAQMREGLFIHKNLNIAPHFKLYNEEKQKINRCQMQRRKLMAEEKKAVIDGEHRERNQFLINKWEIYRKEENERIDKYVKLARKQKRIVTWLTHLKLILTL